MTKNLPAAPVLKVAFQGRCPRCGEGKLFDGFIKIAAKCNVCGLSFEGHDTGDGPAFFIMLPLCVMVAGAALGLEVTLAPPMWVHLTIWPVFIIGVAFAALRPVKGTMVALQYRHRDVETYDDSAQQ